jgi:relaxase-like protein
MSDRVILAARFTPAGPLSQVRKAVGGFLRYVQHRDVHPTQADGRGRPEVPGLLKYVAYRDSANRRAELFGPHGPLRSEDRRAFAAFVAKALEDSRPQQFLGRDGELHDRRRAVYRLVISPERAEGLDLRRLTTVAVTRLEKESGIVGFRWIAAIHRNTAHHHVHLVVAGMHADAGGGLRRIDLTRPRLAAMKNELAHEIQRQRAERAPVQTVLPSADLPKATHTRPLAGIVVASSARSTSPTRRAMRRRWPAAKTTNGSLIALRAIARRYKWRMERELEDAYRQSEWQRAA